MGGANNICSDKTGILLFKIYAYFFYFCQLKKKGTLT